MTILYVVAESDTVHWSVMSVLCVVADLTRFTGA